MRYRKKKYGKQKVIDRKVQAKDVLYDSMVTFKTKANTILKVMLEDIKSSGKANYAELKILYQEFRKCEELAIDIAHKLAPYQSPKLESIEVKASHEHRYVIRVPSQMKSTDEWAKATGATKLSLEELIKAPAIVASVGGKQQLQNEHEDEDSYVEPGMETRH